MQLCVQRTEPGLLLLKLVLTSKWSCLAPIQVIPPTVLINPTITPLSEAVEHGWEGCLSVPGMRGEVPRWSHIRYTNTATPSTVKWMDSMRASSSMSATIFGANCIRCG
mmetsp:Transcript_6881/g.14937  ORF Transcript_6881/g.14937 Transcript_6881/m.14937 type:complete len:109 (+) Transcript_6881:272-598(+)